MQSADCSAWFAGKSLTTDWTTQHFPVWIELLAARRQLPLDVLEVGSWEGRSALFFLNYLPHCRMTCIDTFSGSPEHHLVADWARSVGDIEKRFDENLAEFGARVEKIKAASHNALSALALAPKRYDLAYIDGSHRAADVYADAALSWSLIKPGGLVIFDDYTWVMMPDPADRPKLGIDTFLANFAGQYREVHRGLQIAIEKKPVRTTLKSLFSVALGNAWKSRPGVR